MPNREMVTTRILDRAMPQYEPRHRFMGYSKADWQRWRDALLPELKAALGPFPQADLPPNVETLDIVEFPTYVLHRIIFDVRMGEPVPAFLLMPTDRPEPMPAALCVHGHGPDGKDGVVLGTGKSVPFATKLAEMGIAALCIDNAGMGERDDGGGCELLSARLNLLGADTTGYRVFDLMRAMDLLCSMPEIDSNQIGSVGFSLGCWLAMVHAALDERVKACVLSGRFTTFAQTSWYGRCVCQNVKGVAALCEMPDIAGLIAPRYVCAEWGTEDAERSAYPAFHMAYDIFRAAGVADNIELALFHGGHWFDGTNSLPWLVDKLDGRTLETEEE